MKQLLFTLFCLFAYSSLQAQAVPTDELYGVYGMPIHWETIG